MEDKRTCTKCGETLPIHRFFWGRGRKAPERSCRVCREPPRKQAAARRRIALTQQCIALLKKHGPLTTNQLRSLLPGASAYHIGSALRYGRQANNGVDAYIRSGPAANSLWIPATAAPTLSRKQRRPPKTEADQQQIAGVMADCDAWYASLATQVAAHTERVRTMRARV